MSTPSGAGKARGEIQREVPKVFSTEAFSTTCAEGVVRQVKIIDQWGAPFKDLIKQYETPGAICGYVATAAAIILGGMGLKKEKALWLTTPEVEELIALLSDPERMVPTVETNMAAIHAARTYYCDQNGITGEERRKYMTAWVANYEISDLLQARQRRLVPLCFARKIEHGEVTHEELQRVPEEAPYRDVSVFFEMNPQGVWDGAPASKGYLRTGNTNVALQNRNVFMDPLQFSALVKSDACEIPLIIGDMGGHFIFLLPFIHVTAQGRTNTLMLFNSTEAGYHLTSTTTLTCAAVFDNMPAAHFIDATHATGANRWCAAARLDNGALFRALCLTDRMLTRGHSAAPNSGVPADAAVWCIDRMTAHEAAFYRAAVSEFAQDFAKFNVTVDLHDTLLHLRDARTNAVMTVAEVTALNAALVAAVNNPLRYNYAETVQAVIRETVLLFGELCSDWLDSSRLAEIKTCPVVASGESFMVQYEVSFQADSSSLTVAYPDLNAMSREHAEELARRAPKRADRVFQDHFFMCLQAPCHEVIHCLQGLAKQVDNDPVSWSSEHDASYPCYTLLDHVMERLQNRCEHVFPALREINFLSAYELAISRFESWSPDVKQAYEAWRSSFGLVSPSLINENPATSNHFKSVIANHSFFPLRAYPASALTKQLEAILKGRTGEVHACGPVTVAPEVVVSSTRLVELGNLIDYRVQANNKDK